MHESKYSENFCSQNHQEYMEEEDDDVVSPNWLGSLQKAISGNPPAVFARDVGKDGAKIFTNDLTHEEMLKYQSTQPLRDRNFYEIIIDDKPVKLFYDIDISPAFENMVLYNQLVLEVINITILSMKELYNVHDIEMEDFAVLDSTGEKRTENGVITKTSIHIVLVNKVRFKNVVYMKNYVNFVFSSTGGYVKDKIDFHIDFGVYRNRGSLRIPGSTKKGENRYITVNTNHSELDCLLTYTEDDDYSDLQILVKPTKRNNKRKEEQIIRSLQESIPDNQLSDDEFFRKVVDALPTSLAADYNSWISVGIKLYTAGASEKFWHDFSQKCIRDYNYTAAHSKWLSFKGYGTGNMSSLFRLLRKHDLHEIANEISSHTLRYMGKYNNEIAIGLARLYGDDHVYSKGEWYYFNKVKWVLDEKNTFISKTIMTDFHYRLNEQLRILNEFIQNVPSDHPRYNEEQARIKNLHCIKEKTQSGRINSDWHPMNVAFDQPCFASSLDSFKNLIGFENGVFDLNSNQFIEPDRDHRVTMSTGYDYVHVFEYDDDDPVFDELDILLHRLFPDEHILNYMMCFLGSCLSGVVSEELIHFWTGLSNKQTGSNGKSTFVSLLLLTFGDYGDTGHSSIITSKRESPNNTNSALMKLKGKRLVAFQEIDNEGSINMPVIKSLTGNDQVTGRQLYKTQETFTPQWKLVVCANNMPPVSSDDGGTQRRLRNIPFESKFVPNIEDRKWQGMSNIFPVDYSLKMKLEKFRMPLMHRLIIGYNEYKRMGGLPVCHKILSHTSHYFQQHNLIYQFINKNLVVSQGSKILVREIIHLINNSPMTKAGNVYTEEDVVETCREFFPNIVLCALSESDSRLVIMDHTRFVDY